VDQPSLLELALRVLAAAAAAVLVCVRLRIPTVAGLLVAGALIGPSGLGFVTEVEAVERFAEIGVVLLLFVIGLEFSRDRLRELGRFALVGGTIQVAVTAAAIWGAAHWLGVAGGPALLTGLIVCGSSTALILKVCGDREELDSLHSRAALGISLFQDVLIVPMLIVVPALAASANVSGVQLATRFGAGLAVLTLASLVGRRVLPPLIGAAARGRSREAFLLTAILLCLGTAWLSDRLGLSPALGAFLAGLLLADSDIAHQTLAEVMPLRELFASVFFLSIGMLVDLKFLVDRPATALAATAGVVVLKALIAGGAVYVLGLPHRTAFLAALALAQVGEFSFVLLESGRAHGVLAPDLFDLLLTASALSMLAMPGLVAVLPRVEWRVEAALRRPDAETAVGSPPAVVIVGYGANGEILARILREASVGFTVVDADLERARSARSAGAPVVFGDATRPEILRRAGVASARILVLAISDVRAVTVAIREARRVSSELRILVRTRRLREAGPILRAGADRVVAEEYESAIAIYTWALEELHVPRNVIAAQTRLLRGEDYKLLRGVRPPEGISQSVAEALAEGTTDVFRLTADCGAAGRSLGELDLRRRSGATVLAVVRGESPHLTPSAEFALAAGDELVLVGAHAEIEAAFELLREGG